MNLPLVKQVWSGAPESSPRTVFAGPAAEFSGDEAELLRAADARICSFRCLWLCRCGRLRFPGSSRFVRDHGAPCVVARRRFSRRITPREVCQFANADEVGKRPGRTVLLMSHQP
jgi:hypothetical protein